VYESRTQAPPIWSVGQRGSDRDKGSVRRFLVSRSILMRCNFTKLNQTESLWTKKSTLETLNAQIWTCHFLRISALTSYLLLALPTIFCLLAASLLLSHITCSFDSSDTDNSVELARMWPPSDSDPSLHL
jgi:hypothetical protein